MNYLAANAVSGYDGTDSIRLFDLNRTYLLDKFLIYMIPPVVGQIIGVIFTTQFLFFDQIFCFCCACWRGEEETVVYCPDNPAAKLFIKHGEVVDMDQMDNRDETKRTNDDESEV